MLVFVSCIMAWRKRERETRKREENLCLLMSRVIRIFQELQEHHIRKTVDMYTHAFKRDSHGISWYQPRFVLYSLMVYQEEYLHVPGSIHFLLSYILYQRVKLHPEGSRLSPSRIVSERNAPPWRLRNHNIPASHASGVTESWAWTDHLRQQTRQLCRCGGQPTRQGVKKTHGQDI